MNKNQYQESVKENLKSHDSVRSVEPQAPFDANREPHYPADESSEFKQEFEITYDSSEIEKGSSLTEDKLALESVLRRDISEDLESVEEIRVPEAEEEQATVRVFYR